MGQNHHTLQHIAPSIGKLRPTCGLLQCWGLSSSPSARILHRIACRFNAEVQCKLQCRDTAVGFRDVHGSHPKKHAKSSATTVTRTSKLPRSARSILDWNHDSCRVLDILHAGPNQVLTSW